MALLPITKPCVDKKFFINRKFKEVSLDTYERVEKHPPIVNPFTGLMHDAVRTLQFKIIGIHPEIGTNIEIRIDGRLDSNIRGWGSGYWIDRKDFESTFKNL